MSSRFIGRFVELSDIVAQLQLLEDIETVFPLRGGGTDSSVALASLIDKWRNDLRKDSMKVISQDCELLFLARGVVLSLLMPDDRQRQCRYHLDLASHFRHAARFNLALEAVEMAKISLGDFSGVSLTQCRVQQSKILWAMGEKFRAIHLAKALISEIQYAKWRTSCRRCVGNSHAIGVCLYFGGVPGPCLPQPRRTSGHRFCADFWSQQANG